MKTKMKFYLKSLIFLNRMKYCLSVLHFQVKITDHIIFNEK